MSLTTYRRDGTPVATPVWIAPLPDGRAGFTTGADSGKVKRLRNNPEVSLVECDLRGRVAAGSAGVAATAELVEGDAYEAVADAVRAKYGIQYRLLELRDRAKQAIGRPGPGEVGVVISFTV